MLLRDMPNEGRTYHTILYDVSFSDLRAQSYNMDDALASFCGTVFLKIQDATVNLINPVTREQQPVSLEKKVELFSKELSRKVQERRDNTSTYEEDLKVKSTNNLYHGQVPYSVSIKADSMFNIQCYNI